MKNHQTPRVRRIPGTDVAILSAKVDTFSRRGLDSVEALRDLVTIAEAGNAAVVRQIDHDPVRVEVVLHGVTVVAVKDRWTNEALLLTAWADGVSHARAAVRRAASKAVGRIPLADRLGFGKAAA